MKIKSIQLKNFRNYQNIQLDFDQNLNLIVGENAQGKTNLIEAMFYLSTCKSHRVSLEQLLIHRDCEYSDLQVKLDNNEVIRTFINQNGKSLFINKKNIFKVSDFIGRLNTILFSPDDLNLFHQTPKFRRKFIDIEIGKISKSYTKLLSEYQSLLKSRNLYLKSDNIDFDYIDIITKKMIYIQSLIIKQRKKFIEDLLYYSNLFFEKFGFEKIYCVYETFIDLNQNYENQLNEKYKNTLNKDIKFMQTHLGIHKDDFLFKVGENNVIDFLSQGQKRIVLFCLKIGLVYLIKNLVNYYPVLLLDDVFSELDLTHQEKILKFIPKDVQIFITSCNLNLNLLKNREYAIFNISNGEVL